MMIELACTGSHLRSKYQSVANHEFKAVLSRREAAHNTAYNKENFYRRKWILLELQRNSSSKL